MPRPQIYSSSAEKQRAYRARQKLKRNGIKPINVTKLNKIYCMDALEFVQSLPEKSIDLFITSPPYNLRNSTGGFWRGQDKSSKWSNSNLRTGYTHHDDNMPRSKYVKWQRQIISEMLRALRPDGAIFYNHKPRVQGGLMQSPDEIVKGYPVRQVIIWNRGVGFNFNDTYYLPTYEFIYLICGKKFRLRPGGNTLTDVWTFGHDRNNEHPAPFPEDLPDRILSSVDAKLVCDPFMGSGTVGVSAKRHGINFIGCDISPEYVTQAMDRIQSVQLESTR